MGGYDPIMLHTCIKYHNESQYFIQLIYTNILDVGYCFIIGSIQELEKAKKKNLLLFTMEAQLQPLCLVFRDGTNASGARPSVDHLTSWRVCSRPWSGKQLLNQTCRLAASQWLELNDQKGKIPLSTADRTTNYTLLSSDVKAIKIG